ncbi:RyR domain-containing protein [Tepidamorphus sp. 3E244]|uniref:RyR domain-containing protein n=1 Tax=Tepidamorphus sp. 3E244 TaxID=3385498 RepID=UPI0038FCDEC2
MFSPVSGAAQVPRPKERQAQGVFPKGHSEGLIRLVAAAIALTTLVCGAIGWSLQLGLSVETLAEIAVRTLWLYIPRPEVIAAPENNLVLKVAATLGALSGAIGAVAFYMAAANARLSHFITRNFRRGHTIVIGDTPLARRLVQALRAEDADAVHVSDTPLEPTEKKADERIVTPLKPADIAREAGLLRASSVAIDMGGDAETLVVAKPILRWLEKNGPGSVKRMSVRVADPFLADMFIEFVQRIGLGRYVHVAAFDENRVAARHALSSHPLFVRAAARGQSRVHALIVGFGDLGEKLLDQIILTSIAGDLGEPRVTIVDRNANRLEQQLRTRRPGVCETLAISFIEMDIDAAPMEGTSRHPGVAAIEEMERQDLLTAIYLTLPAPGDNIRAALMLQRQYDRHGTFAAPILYRSRGTVGAEGSLLDVKLPADDAADGFIPLPNPFERLARFVLGEAEIGSLARKLHETYRKGAEQSAAAARDWQDLPETLKRSNIRAADHLKSKLWTLGIGLPLGEGLPNLSQSDRDMLEAFRAGTIADDRVQNLARIEHDRWMVDRKLDGWTLGPERNDKRRIHPKLIPFDDLGMTREDIDKDVKQILAAIDHMLERDAGRKTKVSRR